MYIDQNIEKINLKRSWKIIDFKNENNFENIRTLSFPYIYIYILNNLSFNINFI